MIHVNQHFSVLEVSQSTGLTQHRIFQYIEWEWIFPQESLVNKEKNLNEEDLARIRLIQDLEDDLGVNADGISVILHLIDQIHFLRRYRIPIEKL